MLILLGIIIGIPIGLKIVWEDFDGVITTIFFMLLFGVLGALVGSLLMLAFGAFLPSHWEVHSSANLRSIATGTSTSGSFFLGSGYVDNKLTYTYFAERNDGDFVLKSVEADSAVVRERDGVQPNITKYEKVTNHGWDWLGLATDRSTVITVPKNSVVQNYTLRP